MSRTTRTPVPKDGDFIRTHRKVRHGMIRNGTSTKWCDTNYLSRPIAALREIHQPK